MNTCFKSCFFALTSFWAAHILGYCAVREWGTYLHLSTICILGCTEICDDLDIQEVVVILRWLRRFYLMVLRKILKGGHALRGDAPIV